MRIRRVALSTRSCTLRISKSCLSVFHSQVSYNWSLVVWYWWWLATSLKCSSRNILKLAGEVLLSWNGLGLTCTTSWQKVKCNTSWPALKQANMMIRNRWAITFFLHTLEYISNNPSKTYLQKKPSASAMVCEVWSFQENLPSCFLGCLVMPCPNDVGTDKTWLHGFISRKRNNLKPITYCIAGWFLKAHRFQRPAAVQII